MTLAFPGVRTGEALGLKWADVDFAGHELNVRRAIYRKETTPKKALPNHKAMSAHKRPKIMSSPAAADGP